jgi:hypothetical protein
MEGYREEEAAHRVRARRLGEVILATGFGRGLTFTIVIVAVTEETA